MPKHRLNSTSLDVIREHCEGPAESGSYYLTDSPLVVEVLSFFIDGNGREQPITVVRCNSDGVLESDQLCQHFCVLFLHAPVPVTVTAAGMSEHIRFKTDNMGSMERNNVDGQKSVGGTRLLRDRPHKIQE